MPSTEVMGYVSLVLGLATYIIYWISILKGETRPHLFTHIIWTLTLGITAAGQYAAGAGPGFWSCASSTFGALVNVILALRWGERTITRSDWLAFIIALAAIPLWCVTHNPLPAVIVATFIDGVGYVPTWRKAYIQPHQETPWSYALGNGAMVASILAMDIFSLTTMLYPCVMLALNGATIALIICRRRIISAPTPTY